MQVSMLSNIPEIFNLTETTSTTAPEVDMLDSSNMQSSSASTSNNTVDFNDPGCAN